MKVLPARKYFCADNRTSPFSSNARTPSAAPSDKTNPSSRNSSHWSSGPHAPLGIGTSSLSCHKFPEYRADTGHPRAGWFYTGSVASVESSSIAVQSAPAESARSRPFGSVAMPACPHRRPSSICCCSLPLASIDSSRAFCG